MPVQMTCDIKTLAAEGAGLSSLLDPQQFQAVKTYLLALILKAVTNGEADYTDWCTLAEDMKQYDSLPDYARRAAYIGMLAKTAELAGVSDLETSEATFRKALSCWCCSVSPQTMFSMEIFLLCRLFLIASQDVP
jgi:hypothetical protein